MTCRPAPHPTTWSTDRVERLLAEVDAQFVSVCDAHPEWDGLTVSAATRLGTGWGAYIDGEGRLEFLKSLGFRQNPAVAELDASGGFFADISGEELNVLDADLIVAFPIGVETTDITDDPVFEQIPATVAGRVVVVDGDLADATGMIATDITANTTMSLTS